MVVPQTGPGRAGQVDGVPACVGVLDRAALPRLLPPPGCDHTIPLFLRSLGLTWRLRCLTPRSGHSSSTTRRPSACADTRPGPSVESRVPSDSRSASTRRTRHVWVPAARPAGVPQCPFRQLRRYGCQAGGVAGQVGPTERSHPRGELVLHTFVAPGLAEAEPLLTRVIEAIRGPLLVSGGSSGCPSRPGALC